MSNFDREINEAVKADLLNGVARSDHPAWEYHAIMWYDAAASRWNQAVSRYHLLQCVFYGPDFEAVLYAPDQEWGTG